MNPLKPQPPPGNPTKLSVVIPTCQRNDLLALCLERLAPGAQSLAASDYEVIVTDDGSTATARQMIQDRFPWARWIQGPRRGPAANRNNGTKIATGDWLVFTDDDCLPSARFLNAYHRTILEDARHPVLEGRTSAVGQKDHPLASAPINETGGYLWSCNFAIRTELFRSVNGFDERFPFASMEDMDLHVRLKRSGNLPIFVPEALVEHPWKRVADPNRFLRQHLFSQMLYVELHPNERRRVSLRNHLHYWTRHFVKVWPRDVFTFGWPAISTAPGLIRRILIAAWVLSRRPRSSDIRPR
jgi:GT2 family glycosyltransferase